MDRNECRFTVLFQPPFWVGIGERWTEEGYQAARVVFGAEPSDAQVYQREADGLERRARRSAQRRAEQEKQFRLRQQKKREKRRSH